MGKSQESSAEGPLRDKALVAVRASEARLAARIVSAIQTEVAAYGNAGGGRNSAMLAEVVGVAIHEMIKLVDGKPKPSLALLTMMQGIGWAEAVADENLNSLRAAFEVAMREAWIELHRISREQKLSGAEVGWLGDTLFVLMGSLRDAAERGHDEGQAARAADVVVARDGFVRHLLGAEHGDNVEQLGALAGWPPPPRSLVLCLESPPTTAQITRDLADAGAFVLVDGEHLLVLYDERERDEGVERVRASLAEATPICVSPPAVPRFLPDALRLARRAHGLIGQQMIAPVEIVDCNDHLAALWLQAEPLLRQQAVDRLLTPIQGLRPQRRQVLGATLAMWLEHRGSAPAIGEQLGVHPQTVRYRLRQLEELLGKQLEDPDATFTMLLGLKASLPLWAAELPTTRGLDH